MRTVATWAAAAAVAAIGWAGTAMAGAIYETEVLASPGGSESVGRIHSTGRPFDILSGEAKITDLGGIKVELAGLLHPNGTPTALEVFATLVCGGSPAAHSEPVPIDDMGDAKIEESGFVDTSVVDECRRPIILVRRNGCFVDGGCNNNAPGNTRWLAISGYVPPLD